MFRIIGSFRNSLSPAKSKKKAVKIFPDDVFIVSYPKSGNTWVRFLLANLFTNSNSPIDFHTAIKYVPEMGEHNNVLECLERPRIIKSHSLYDKNFPKLVYLVRDPRDVYVSYYHYLSKKLPDGMSFSEFLRKSELYPSRWHEHVYSWIDKPNILLVKYEQLLSDTFNTFSKILKFIGRISFAREEILSSIKASSFNQMKRLEQEKGRPFMSKEDEQKASLFMRKGERGDWVNYFSHDDLDFLYSETKHLMHILGYCR